LGRGAALVTGAAGFIGANLARRLCADGYYVHLAVRPGSDLWRVRAVERDAEIHRLDLADREAVSRMVAEVKPEFIFHAAAHGAYPNQTDRDRMLAVNVHGTVNLLAAALETGFAGFVHTGSSSEYGFKDHPPHEDEHLEPNSAYAVTKAAATLYCQFVARGRDLNVTTLRLYSAYGPFEEPSRLVPTLITRGLAGQLPELAAPETARDYIHVDDVVEACVIAAGSGRGRIYNVGTGVQTTLADAVGVARRVMGIEVEPRWGSMAGRAWDTAVWVADPTLAASELGWRARLDFESGLGLTAEWLRGTPGMLDFYRSRQSTGA
jgi:UDP-glucose 4-epimerase